jgi:hypothetical protein
MWNKWIVLLVGLLSPWTLVAQSPPDSLELFRAALARLDASDALSLHIEKRFDVILLNGAKIEYSGALEAVVKRSDGLYLNYGDDLSAKQLWYDGTTMTLLDDLNNVYASVGVSGPVPEALTQVSQEYGLELPLAPLLKKNLIDELDKLGSDSYLGIHDVEGVACHHLLFRSSDKDMQIWIRTGAEPLLCKLVVTFWDIEGAPQQSLTFSDWKLDADIDSDVFKPQLPEDATAIEFLPVEEE